MRMRYADGELLQFTDTKRHRHRDAHDHWAEIINNTRSDGQQRERKIERVESW